MQCCISCVCLWKGEKKKKDGEKRKTAWRQKKKNTQKKKRSAETHTYVAQQKKKKRRQEGTKKKRKMRMTFSVSSPSKKKKLIYKQKTKWGQRTIASNYEQLYINRSIKKKRFWQTTADFSHTSLNAMIREIHAVRSTINSSRKAAHIPASFDHLKNERTKRCYWVNLSTMVFNRKKKKRKSAQVTWYSQKKKKRQEK